MFRTTVISMLAACVLLAGNAGVEAKTLVYCSEANPTTLSPALTTAQTDVHASVDQIFDTLTEVDPITMQVVPALAESWDVAEDGLSYTFHLRQEVQFQTTPRFTPARPFNADDVVFSLQRQLDPEHPYHEVSDGRYNGFEWLGLPDVLDHVEAVDTATVRFRLKSPNALFLTHMATPYVAIHSAEYADLMMAAGTPEELDNNPVGTGPFQLVDYRRDTHIRYQAHPGYWRGKPAIDQLVFQITPDPAVRLQKLRAGECHIAPYPNPADIGQMRADPEIEVLETFGLSFGFLAMNMERGPFADDLVRRAITAAIDKPAIIDAVFQGIAGQVARGPVPPVLFGDPPPEADPPDPDLARRLLSEAGLENGFEATLWAMPVQRPYNPNPRRMAELIQADLAAIGVRATIVSYEWGEYLKRAREGEHDMVLLGWITDGASPDSFLRSLWTCDQVETGYNFARWCDPHFDELLEQARLELDPAARADVYRAAQEIWQDRLPAVPIAHDIQFVPVRKEVTGYVADPFDRRFFYNVDLAG